MLISTFHSVVAAFLTISPLTYALQFFYCIIQKNPSVPFPPTQVTHAVENLCLYSCPQDGCGVTFDRFWSLQTHFRNKHGVPDLRFRAGLLAEARFHRCWECGMVVLCEKSVSSYSTSAADASL